MARKIYVGDEVKYKLGLTRSITHRGLVKSIANTTVKVEQLDWKTGLDTGLSHIIPLYLITEVLNSQAIQKTSSENAYDRAMRGI